MAYDDPRKAPRCNRCGHKVRYLDYVTVDGKPTRLKFVPPEKTSRDDVQARKYVMYTGADDVERARLVTTTEPWDEHTEHPLKEHFIVCEADPRSPAYKPAHLRTSPHHPVAAH